MKKIIYVVAATLLAFTVNAHNGATGIVKERMDVMSSMGKSTKKLAKLVRTKDEPNYNEIADLSQRIAQSNAGLLVLFPEGSLSHASEARERIWLNWEEFSKLMKQSETAAQNLSDAANSGASAAELKQSFKNLNKSCKSCHRKYRKKK